MTQAHRRFPSTSWDLVRKAGRGTGTNGALEELLRRYAPALQAHLVHVKRLPPDQAEDLLQSFILDKVIQQQLVARADERRGRFRTFLLTVLDNYVRNAWRREARRPRALSFTGDDRREVFDVAEAKNLPPHAVFDVQWAQQIIVESVRRMEAMCRENGSSVAWEVFHSRILEPTWHGQRSESYGSLVERLGLTSPAQAHNALATGKRMFHRALRTVVAEYTSDPAEVEEEITELKQVLSSASAMKHRE